MIDARLSLVALSRAAAGRSRWSRCDEGSTPLIRAPRLSERVGIEVWLKFEGANPTGSFKDRGMTVAVSAAMAEGAEAVICASTGNTAASAAAYAARAGMRCAVIVPEGKIATGKLAQALMHGARVVALRGNFDQALELVRELVERHPSRSSTRSTTTGSRVRRRPRSRSATSSARRPTCSASRSATPATSPPGGAASREYGHAPPRLYGFQAEGAAPLVTGGRSSTRRRSPRRSGSATRRAGRRRWRPSRASRGEIARGHRRRDPRRAALLGVARRRVLRAGIGRVGRRAPEVRRRGLASSAC